MLLNNTNIIIFIIKDIYIVRYRVVTFTKVPPSISDKINIFYDKYNDICVV